MASLSFSLTSRKTEQTPSTQKTVKEITNIQCSTNLLRSYLLKGRETSKTQPLIFCPEVTQSCCTKLDQQRIYHVVNDLLKDKLKDYQMKVQMAFARLKSLQEEIKEKRFYFSGSKKRKRFCQKQHTKLKEMNLKGLINEILEEFKKSETYNFDFYSKFFCMICDANLKYTLLQNQDITQILFENEHCQQFLLEQKKLIDLLNNKLMTYLIRLQNLADCSHFVRVYHLKFFDQEKINLRQNVVNCLQNLETKLFVPNCRNICSQMTHSKINPLIQGDLDFLLKGLSIFEQFIHTKETGAFISNKLKSYLSKFIFPHQYKHNQQRKIVKQKLRLKQKNNLKRNLDQNQQNLNLEIYDEIHFNKQITQESHIFEIPSKPFDFDQDFSKSFVDEGGLNYKNYSILKFNLPEEEFYEKLTQIVERDKNDNNLDFFLSDFGSQFKEGYNNILDQSYFINKRDYTYKKKEDEEKKEKQKETQ